jgi:hypothetical protein
MMILILDDGQEKDPSSYLLMRCSDDRRYAIRIVDKPSYYGFDVVQPAEIGRGTSGEALRVIAPVSKKRWAGTVILDKVPSGFVTGPDSQRYSIAFDNQVPGCLRNRELEVYCFGDSEFWSAAWDRAWVPNMAYDPLAIKRRLSLGLVER